MNEYRELTTNLKIFVWSKLAPLGKAHRFYGNSDIEVLNAAVSRVAAAEGVKGLDMCATLATNIEALVVKDGIHLQPEGCRLVAEATYRAISRRVAFKIK